MLFRVRADDSHMVRGLDRWWLYALPLASSFGTDTQGKMNDCQRTIIFEVNAKIPFVTHILSRILKPTDNRDVIGLFIEAEFERNWCCGKVCVRILRRIWWDCGSRRSLKTFDCSQLAPCQANCCQTLIWRCQGPASVLKNIATQEVGGSLQIFLTSLRLGSECLAYCGNFFKLQKSSMVGTFRKPTINRFW